MKHGRYRMWRSVGKASAYATLVRQMLRRRRRPLPDHRGTAACWSGDSDCSSPCQVSHIMISISINCAYWCTSRSLETPWHTLMTCCSPVSDLDRPTQLRSASKGDLVVPRTRLKLGERAFRVAAPWLWNELPPDIRKLSTLATFKKHLKTFLFCKHYGLVLEQ